MADNTGKVVPKEPTKKERYDRVWSMLDGDRSTFMPLWRELNDYILPTRGRFLITDRNRGDRRSKFIVDSTATFAARTLSSGMMAGLTSPARPWKRLTTPDPDLREVASVKEWLHIVNQRMDTVFAQSNWYNKLPLLYDDMGTFASGAMMIEEDEETVIRCTSFPIGTFWIGTDSKGRVRVFFREFQMTVRQIVERFTDGKDLSNLSSQVSDKWEKGQHEDWYDVRHVVMPNKEYDGTKLTSKPFTSCYYERNGPADKLLEEKGYDEWPILCGRWSTTGEDTYGTNSPGITVLGDVKALQLGEKRAAQAMEKLINPPMVAPPAARTARLSLLPGDVSYLPEGPTGQPLFRPAHEVRPDLQDWEYRQEQIRKRINTGYYADLFLMLTYADPQRGVQPPTAAEIAVRQEEKLLAIGPVLEGLNEDVLDPAIDRVFAIMVRAGLIPPPPQELQGVSLKVEYISIMAQAQKSIGIGGLERFAGFVNTMAAEDPTVLDKVDRDQMIDEYADMTGVAPRIVVPDDDVAKIRADRARQQQAEKATQLAAMESQSAKNLSAARVAPDNALGQLLQSGGPAAPINPLQGAAA